MNAPLLAMMVSLVTLAVTGACAAPPPTGAAAAQFESANQLYEQGRFAEAAAAYEAIRQSGVASAALHFNLGNARFKSAQIGRALAAYRQAQQLAPRDPDVRANLQFARNQVQGPSRQTGRMERWLRNLSLNEWTGLTAGAFWLTLISLSAIQWRPGLTQPLRSLVLGGGLATVMLGGCLALALSHRLGAETAIVTARETTVRLGPFDESPAAFTARDGGEWRVRDRKEDWLQITDDQHRTGWIKQSDVTLLNRS